MLRLSEGWGLFGCAVDTRSGLPAIGRWHGLWRPAGRRFSWRFPRQL